MNPVKGMIFSLCATALIATMNAFAKLLAPYIGPIEVVFWRGLIAAVLLGAGLVILGYTAYLKTNNPKAQIIRALIGTAAMSLNMWAISLLPLSTISSIRLMSPLIVLMLSWPLLGERVGPRRIMAALVGLFGAVIIVDPFSVLGETIPLKGLLVTIAFVFGTACVDIVLRWIGDKKKEPAMTTAFYFLILSALFTLPFVMLLPDTGTPALLANFEMNMKAIWLLAGLGVTGAIGMTCKSQGFKLAPVSVISPLSYTIIIWATLFDWLIWDYLPNLNVYIGAGIIIAANLFVIWRERQELD